MSHSQPKQPAALATRLYPLSWPCRDQYTGSLYPVPPGQSRRERFCFRCLAPICLFGGTPAERRMGKRRRYWALPDLDDFEVYLSALRLYTSLLTTGRTCWRCAHLRHLRGNGDCYICAHMAEAHLAGGECGPATITAWQAQLSTSLEICGDVAFQEREGAIPQVSLTEWRAMANGRHSEAGCAWCAHLQRFHLAGRERFICALEAKSTSRAELWRRGRSWKVIRARYGRATWCHGELWERASEEEDPALIPLPPR